MKILLTILVGASLWAQDDPFRGPGIADLLAIATFYASFDQGAYPDLAAGPEARPHFQGLQTSAVKEPQFSPGLLGRALVLGHGMVVYPAAGNANVGGRGAIAFWVKPEDWQYDKDGNCMFFSVSGQFIIERQGPDGGRRHASILTIAHGEDDRRASSIQSGDLKNGEWTFFVCNWSWPEFSISRNGDAPRAKATKGVPPLDRIPEFRLGTYGRPSALLDEVIIFSRPLAPAEIARLYRAFLPLLPKAE